jgi:hypothetical protein
MNSKLELIQVLVMGNYETMVPRGQNVVFRFSKERI